MKILRILPTMDPRYGGPVEGLKLSASFMDRWGHDTEIVTLDQPQAPYLTQVQHAVHPVGRWIRRYGYTPAMARWIARHGSRFDVAIVHGLWNHASIGGWHGLRKAGLPYVAFTHGMMDPWFRRDRLKYAAKQVFWRLWQGRVLRDASEVLFTSEEERLAARGQFFDFGYRDRVVAYGAAEPDQTSIDEIGPFRATIPGLGQRPYLLFLGRLHPKKGCDLLIDAFAAIADRHRDVDLVLAGPDDAGHGATLQQLSKVRGVASRIHWPGMVQGRQKWAALHGCEALILPSHQENFGIVVAEAMVCARPVLVSDKVNIWREVISSGGGLVAPDTVVGVEALLSEFLALPASARMNMGQRARHAYDRHFSAERAARDLTAVLEKAAENG